MLGEKVGEVKGKSIGQRVTSVDAQGPTVEISFQASGTVLGVEITNLGSYSSVLWPGNVLHGEGQGVIMTLDGQSATWVGQGTGHFTGPGSISWRGALYYRTSSERLARLNGMTVVYEYETDQEGNVQGTFYEWK